MKIIFMWFMLSQWAYAAEEVISVTSLDGQVRNYSSKDYEVVKKKEKSKEIFHADYTTKKFRLKSNSISLYMGRGPTHIFIDEKQDGSKTYYLDQDNLYGIGLSQRIGQSFHLEMIGLSNETIMSGVKFEFGSP